MSTQHVVKRGETLGGIAKLRYGDAQQWPIIAAHNRLLDRDRILVGQSLKLPPRLSVMSNGSRTSQSPRNGSSSSASKTASTPDLLDVLGLNPKKAYCTADGLQSNLLPRRPFGANSLSDEKVLMQRGMNPALPVALPICKVSFSRENVIAALPKVTGVRRGYVSTLEVSLFGDVEATMDGVLDCDLTEAKVKAAARKVVWQGMLSALNRESSVEIAGKDFNPTLSFTLHGANNGKDVTFKLALLAGESTPLRRVFEVSRQVVTFKKGNSQMTGTLGMRIVSTDKPLPPEPQHPVPVGVSAPLPKRSPLRFSPGELVPRPETVMVGLIILATAALILLAPKAAVGFAAAVVVVGLGRLLNQMQNMMI